jgi:hypothetical protein
MPFCDGGTGGSFFHTFSVSAVYSHVIEEELRIWKEAEVVLLSFLL